MDGPARDALVVAAARALAVLRVFGVLLQVVAVVAWPGWYFTSGHLVVPLVAAGWGVVFIVRCLRSGFDRVIAAGELAVTTVLLLSMTWSLPPDLVHGPNWVILRLAGASLAICWCVAGGTWLLCTVVLAAAGIAGGVVAGLSPASATGAVVIEVVAATMCVVASSVMRRGAANADRALVRAGARQRAQAVAAKRVAAAREAERVLHDTVLNMLAGLAWGASGTSDELVRARCLHTVDECADMLGVSGVTDVPLDLPTRLADVVAQASRDGLTVGTSMNGRAHVPPDVAAALAGTVAEALSNVRRHAGVSEAEVTLDADDGGVSVTVRDRGTGFEPTTAPPDRLGVRYSIMDRMADIGGSADVDSGPGRGTTVTLRWSPDPVSQPSLQATTRMLERSYALDAATAAGVGAFLWQLGVGLLLVARLGAYRFPLVVLGGWAVTVGALAWCVAVAGRGRWASLPFARQDRPAGDGRPPRGGVLLLVAATLGAQIAAGLSARAGVAAPLNWVVLVMDGVLVFLQATRPARAWLPVAFLSTGTAVAVVGWRSGFDPAAITRAGTLLYALFAFLAAMSVLWRARRTTTEVTARAARTEADLAADRLVTVTVRRDRHERLHRLAEGPLLLLADIGSGRLDPRDGTVQRRSAASSAALRRSLAQQLRPSTMLVTALEPPVADAERRGVRVEVQVAGGVDGLPAPTQEEVVGAVATILAGIADGRVLLTVLGDRGGGSVSVAFGVPPDGLPVPRPSGGRWIDCVEDVDEGRVCLEVRWGAPASTLPVPTLPADAPPPR